MARPGFRLKRISRPCITRRPSDSNTITIWDIVTSAELQRLHGHTDWVLGLAFHVAGGIIHVLLVIAVVLFVVNLLTGRRTTI